MNPNLEPFFYLEMERAIPSFLLTYLRQPGLIDAALRFPPVLCYIMYMG